MSDSELFPSPPFKWYTPRRSLSTRIKRVPGMQRINETIQSIKRPSSLATVEAEWNIGLSEDVILYIMDEYLLPDDIRALAMVSHHFSLLCRPLIFRDVAINLHVCGRVQSRGIRVELLHALIKKAPEIPAFIHTLRLADARSPVSAIQGTINRSSFAYSSSCSQDPRAALHDDCVKPLLDILGGKYKYPNITTLFFHDEPSGYQDPRFSLAEFPQLYWQFMKKIGPQIRTLHINKQEYPRILLSLFPNLFHLHFGPAQLGASMTTVYRVEPYTPPELTELRTLVMSDSTAEGDHLHKTLKTVINPSHLQSLRVELATSRAITACLKLIPVTLTELEMEFTGGVIDRNHASAQHLPQWHKEMDGKYLNLARMRSLLRLSIIAPNYQDTDLKWIRETVKTLAVPRIRLEITITKSDRSLETGYRIEVWQILDDMCSLVESVTIVIKGYYSLLADWTNANRQLEIADEEYLRRMKNQLPLLRGAGKLEMRIQDFASRV